MRRSFTNKAIRLSLFYLGHALILLAVALVGGAILGGCGYIDYWLLQQTHLEPGQTFTIIGKIGAIISMLTLVLLAFPISFMIFFLYIDTLFAYLYDKTHSKRMALDQWLQRGEKKQLIQVRDDLRRKIIEHSPQSKPAYRIASFTSPDEYLRWRTENPQGNCTEEEMELIDLEEKIKKLESARVD